LIGRVAADMNAPVIDIGPWFAAAIRAGQDPYRPGDGLHPNELGQRLICAAIAPAVIPLLTHDSVQRSSPAEAPHLALAI
jgi:lysophospholipase L1-like esterase